MTEKSAEGKRARAIKASGGTCRTNVAQRFGGFLPSERLHPSCLVFATLLLVGGLSVLQAKPKTDKFEGTVVVVGPKAITVKSRYNIYLVRTFHYSAELEQKMLRHKPEAGKKVTVHYVRGSDLALKVD